MAISYYQATKLYEQTLKDISKNEFTWKQFLTSSCKNYRLSFDDMVMIYAQRPDAIAVLEMEDWNKKYGLWIKPKSKGIAVFDPHHDGYARLRYYFDISDTRKTNKYRPVPIWSMKSEYEKDVIDTLVNHFGVEETNNLSLADAIIQATDTIVEEGIGDYFSELKYYVKDTFLEELDELNLQLVYTSLLKSSISYVALTRCGIEADDYISDDALRLVAQFNSQQALNAIGVPTRDMAQMLIGEIKKTVLECIQNQNRTFELDQLPLYNEPEQKIPNIERSQENETRIHSNGRTIDSQLNTQGRRENHAWEIRLDEKTLSQRTSSDTIHKLFDNTDTQSTLDGDRPDRHTTPRSTAPTDDETTRSERSVERIQSDGMDSKDEQYRGNDSRNSPSGTDLRLEETQSTGNPFGIPAFLSQETFEELLKKDKFHAHKNKDIVTVFELFDNQEKRIAYVKESFKKMYVEEIISDTRYGYYNDTEKNVLRVWKGNYSNPEFEADLSWEDVTRFIEDMIERNVFLSIPLKPLLSSNEQQLNLFDLEPFEPAQKEHTPKIFQMPQSAIDTVLSDDMNIRDLKIRVAAFLSHDRPLEENAAFIKEMYRKGYAGFIQQNRHISVQWDQTGMMMTWGNGIINSFEHQLFSWEEVAKGIRRLLDTGRYLPQEELNQLSKYEYHQGAQMLWYMAQDMSDEADEKYMLPKEYHFQHGFPNDTKELAALLHDNDFLQRTIEYLKEFSDAYRHDHELMRFKLYNPIKVLSFIEHLDDHRLTFSAPQYQLSESNYFITQDYIDHVICRHTDAKYKLLSYFSQHTDVKERVQFIKNEWGISGSNSYSADGKGIKILYGDSVTKPKAFLFMKWKEVEQRISYLIRRNQFLTPEEELGKSHYERQQIANAIHSFFYRLPFSNLRPYKVNEFYHFDSDNLAIALRNDDNVKHILDLMNIALENTADIDENYQNMKDSFQMVQQYYLGTYSAFNERKETQNKTYIPILDTQFSLAVRLNSFYKEHDPYEYNDNSHSSEEENIQDFIDSFHDVGALIDTIKHLNLSIDESDDIEEKGSAIMLREELSMLYTFRHENELIGKNEINFSFARNNLSSIPRYNTGDMVFFSSYNETYYGTIELIDDESIVLNLYQRTGTIDPIDVTLERKWFDTVIRQDLRNQYLYDEDKVMYQNDHIETVQEAESSIPIYQTVAIENYELLHKIAPLLFEHQSDYMAFQHTKEDRLLELFIENNQLVIEEHDHDDVLLSSYTLIIDDVDHLLNFREYIIDEKSYQLALTDGEPDDYEEELQLNEMVQNYIQTLNHQNYRFSKGRIDDNGVQIDFEFDKNGNMISFSGSDIQLEQFKQRYLKTPLYSLSSLIPNEILEIQKINTSNSYAETEQENDDLISDKDTQTIKAVNILPTQKETESKVKQVPFQSTSQFSSHKLFPQYEDHERNNFHITNMELGVGGPKAKYQANIRAIRLLKQLENESRLATTEEQEILSQYVGWGSLADAFDETKENWKQEYQELKELLTDDEYKAARESTLTAFFTPPIVIQAIYKKLNDMGLVEGNILEPSCGIGNFIGMQPKEMNCNFYGVELDTISGQIAKQLYQKEIIAIQGFQDLDIPNHIFDAVIGNVPFGQIPIFDPQYKQNNFMIHDYFFAKALDKVKVGGVVIFITSHFTMDKKNSNVRRYIAQRADLLGAIRLPDNTFTANARTKVTSDILVLQKRERPYVHEPEWLNVENNDNGLTMNAYFANHPHMILGEMVEESSPYGKAFTCKAIEGQSLSTQLEQAFSHITAQIDRRSVLFVDEEDHSIPADPNVRNFSFCVSDGKLYYRENSRMYPHETNRTAENRIRGLIQIRDCLRELIEMQTKGFRYEDIAALQKELHTHYDMFTLKYGLINDNANKRVFQEDASYGLLCSLEVLNEDKTLKRKADIFDKQTIRPNKEIHSVENADEALTVSMAEKGRVDLKYMSDLSKLSEEQLIENLKGVIFRNPRLLDQDGNPVYETADEYLSGNVREKLVFAKHAAKQNPELYTINVKALEQVQPEPIKAGDISVRLGNTWIPKHYYEEFMYQLLDTPDWKQKNIKILYVAATQEWTITRKGLDSSVKSNKTYGTNRINAYKIIENTLNLRPCKIFDKVLDDDGKEKRVLNKRETAIAQDKQEIIKRNFNEWIWKDPERREDLCQIYNEQFNSIRNRTYDGSHLTLAGMNTDIQLRSHQLNAIARVLYHGNTLLAHCVGAGKSFEMIASGMESKRLGLCKKPIYVVPNNIIGDFASDFYRLYPSANILVSTKDTFSKTNRHKFFSKISTCEWDGIIIAHSQFTKMPISLERQQVLIEQQIEDISEGICQVKNDNGENFTIKQLEAMRKKMEERLKKLNDQSNKDDILCFEQLGIDMMFIDEADLFKNLFIYSKMTNVSGISQTDSQRASDLFAKTQYLNEITNNRGVVFATGTPVSNSMAELYTMQRYLQYDLLKAKGLESFDAWASTFGETTTAMELTPDGTKFQLKTRFAKFFNLPELMTMFREVADIQTADMLDLPTPKANYKVISVPASPEQKEMIQSLGERAEQIKGGNVDPHIDNMLKITSDGKKLALEQRLINTLLPENKESKVMACVNNVYETWKDTKENLSTQLIFCDMSTPKNSSKNINEESITNETEPTFTSVYEDIKRKLVKRGIPSHEIAFIHDTNNNEVLRKELFANVRSGKVRILIGSTSKMGAGSNMQDRIISLHDLDCPWRPRDLEQRSGRAIRQGNINPEVNIIRYVTEGTFDAYMFQTIEKKQSFISQVITGRVVQRSMDEVDDMSMRYAEIKAIACGDPKIMERCNLDIEVNKLNDLKSNYLNQKYELQDNILKRLPREMTRIQEEISRLKEDIILKNQNQLSENDEFIGIELDGVSYKDKAEAGTMLIELARQNPTENLVYIGKYRDFSLYTHFSMLAKECCLTIKNKSSTTITLGTDKLGNFSRMNNALKNLDKRLVEAEHELQRLTNELKTSKIEFEKPFIYENELNEKTKRLAQLTMELKLDEKDPDIIDDTEIDPAKEKITERALAR